MLHHALVQPCFNFLFFVNLMCASYARNSSGSSWGVSVDLAHTDAARTAALPDVLRHWMTWSPVISMVVVWSDHASPFAVTCTGTCRVCGLLHIMPGCVCLLRCCPSLLQCKHALQCTGYYLSSKSHHRFSELTVSIVCLCVAGSMCFAATLTDALSCSDGNTRTPLEP